MGRRMCIPSERGSGTGRAALGPRLCEGDLGEGSGINSWGMEGQYEHDWEGPLEVSTALKAVPPSLVGVCETRNKSSPGSAAPSFVWGGGSSASLRRSSAR